jgi:nucleoside-diphosphate-sugar epimerase
MTCVITGARGYIGSVLARRLADEGRALRLVSKSAALPRIEPARGGKIEYCEADLRDSRTWLTLLKDAASVVHLSSRTDLRAAEVDPRGDEDINVAPIRALVQAATMAGTAPVVLFASTVTIVGAEPQLPVDETEPDRPCSVYDRHKLACEMILREATERGVVQSCSLRLSNVYGYGGSSINANRGVLNVMLKRAFGGEPLTLFGDGAYTRDYTHVDDVAEAFCRTLTHPSVCDGRHYVIASGRGYSLAEAYALIAEAALEWIGRRVDIRRITEPLDLHPIEKRNFIGNPVLFERRTGWQPRFDLPAGIRDYFVRTLSAPAMTVAQ